MNRSNTWAAALAAAAVSGVFVFAAAAHAAPRGGVSQAAQAAPRGLGAPTVDVQSAGPSAQMLQQAYADAENHYRHGQDAQALQLFSSLIELAPQYRDAAWLRVGNIHQRAGAGGAALDAYRRLLPGEAQTPMQKGDAATQALRLKGMVNLLTLSMQQTEAALSHIALLQQDPGIRAAAGLDAEAEAALVQGLLDQAARIQQMLGRTPSAVASAHAGYVQHHADVRAAGASNAAASRVPVARAPAARISAAGAPAARVPAVRAHQRAEPPQMLIGNPVVPAPASVFASASVTASAPVFEAGATPVPAESRSNSSTPVASKPVASTRPAIEYLDAPVRGQ